VPPETTVSSVLEAIRTGYRSIDTAEGYNNEEGVGQAIRECGVPREELFVTSKLRNGGHARDLALHSFDDTMKKLGLEVLDLFLIHWPVVKQNRYAEAWKTMVELKQQGRIRSIGVSNFNQDHLERIIGESGVTPAVNQIELHPGYQQRDKREYLRKHSIAIESYSPLGSGRWIDDPTIGGIAKTYGKSPAQIMIRWQLDEGIIVIPKSVHAERIRSNFDVFGFSLTPEDRRRIEALDDPRNGKIGADPATANFLF
jgi:2,5-diketo-D-gluconate reductase A